MSGSLSGMLYMEAVPICSAWQSFCGLGLLFLQHAPLVVTDSLGTPSQGKLQCPSHDPQFFTRLRLAATRAMGQSRQRGAHSKEWCCEGLVLLL